MKKLITLIMILTVTIIITNTANVSAKSSNEAKTSISQSYDLKQKEKYMVPLEDTIITTHGEVVDFSFNISNSNTKLKKEFKDVRKKTSIITMEETFTYKFKVKDKGEKKYNASIILDGEVYETIIYVYSTNMKDYVSTISSSTPKKMHFNEQLELGLIDKSEYNDFVYGTDGIERVSVYDYNEQSLSLNSMLLSTNSTNIRIKGTIQYENTDGLALPAVGAKYVIYDQQVGYRRTLYSGYLSNTGSYDVTLSNKNGLLEDGYDIIVKIFFGNEDTHVEDLWMTYNHEFDKYQNIPNSTVLVQDYTFEKDSERNDAMHIFQASRVGFKHLKDISGDSSFSSVQIEFPSLDTGSFYDFFTNTINIHSTDGHDWDTILHEFGHYVADIYGISDFWPAKHSLSDNLSDDHGKNIGTMLAWSEGWAHYFSISAQVEYNHLINQDDAGTIYYHGYNIEDNTYWKYGESNEWVIARLLYDMTDVSATEAFDSVSLTHSGLFDELTDARGSSLNIWNLSEFMEDLYNQTPNIDYGELLSYYNISATPTVPDFDTNTGSKSPKFEWDQGGDGDYVNTSFTLVITTLNHSTVISKNVGAMPYHYLTNAEWDLILDEDDSTYLWYVEAYQHTGLNTGPYKSKTITFSFPSAEKLSLTSTEDSYLSIMENEWFEYTPTSSGYYNFYTTGTTDTFGELAYRIVADNITTDIFTQNDNRGSGNNFFIRVYLIRTNTINIRVRSGGLNASGSYEINVEQVSISTC